MHVSSRYYELSPIVAAAAADAGLRARVSEDALLSEADERAGKAASTWVALAADAAVDARLAATGRWRALVARPGTPHFTDAFSSLLAARRR